MANRAQASADRRGVTGTLPVSSSVGKRQRERLKLERAQVNAKRKTARHLADAASEDVIGISDRTEPELIDELAALQQAFGDGEISAEGFAEGRGRIQAQLERLLS